MASGATAKPPSGKRSELRFGFPRLPSGSLRESGQCGGARAAQPAPAVMPATAPACFKNRRRFSSTASTLRETARPNEASTRP